MEKVISFAGVEYGDFVYFVASLLRKAQKAVLVIDNSYANDIYHAVTGNMATRFKYTGTDYVVKQNITYMRDVSINSGIELPFDYVLIWHGLVIRNEMLERSDHIYLLPDYTPMVLHILREHIDKPELVDRVIMRNSVESSKITEKTVSEVLSVDIEKFTDILVYDAKDYESYLSFLYNGRAQFNGLSSDYTKAIQNVGKDILEVDDKTIKKIYAKSRR